jgi:DNA-binding NtrC family response regulator
MQFGNKCLTKMNWQELPAYSCTFIIVLIHTTPNPVLTLLLMVKKTTILILDADDNSCEEMREFLRKEGFHAFSAFSAAEGNFVLNEMTVDIMILDIHLQDASGIQFFKECKTVNPNLEGIFISGHGDLDSAIHALRVGALDFLRKPLRHDDLLQAIERYKNARSARIAVEAEADQIVFNSRSGKPEKMSIRNMGAGSCN